MIQIAYHGGPTMGNSMIYPTDHLHDAVSIIAGIPSSISLELTVTDSESVRELACRQQGPERDQYALGALRIGLLSLKYTQGQLDADAVRREGNRLLENLNSALSSYRAQLNEGLTGTLREYFDPQSGKFQERLERLIRRDGDLEQVLRRGVGSEGSELATTLAATVGADSPLMRMLNPEESGSLACTVQSSVQEVMNSERDRILSEFSLDNKDSALSRLVSEITEES